MKVQDHKQMLEKAKQQNSGKGNQGKAKKHTGGKPNMRLANVSKTINTKDNLTRLAPILTTVACILVGVQPVVFPLLVVSHSFAVQMKQTGIAKRIHYAPYRFIM